MNSLTNLSTLAKVGALTFAGAFFGALSMTTLPVDLNGWKALVMPALGAAIAAELVFLRQQIASFLAGTTLTTLPDPVAEAKAAAAKITAAAGMTLALAIGLGAVVVGTAATVTSCLTKPEEIAITTAGENVGACVVGQALNGATPAQIVAACAGVTIADIPGIIEAFLNQPAPDGGVSVPQLLPADRIERLRAVAVEAQTLAAKAGHS